MQKCHVECANENKMKLNLYKQVNYKFYCYNCTNSVLPFQNVNNYDYDCFYESDKSSITRLDDASYLDLYSVKFNKKKLVLFIK